MAKREPKVDELSYEQAIEQLEGLIERIESGEVGLEESLRQYEAGMALIKRCRSILSSAEAKIAELTANGAGELRVKGEEPVEAEADDGEDEDDVPI